MTDKMVSVDPPAPAVSEAVARALAEDLLPLGDLTAGLVPPTAVAQVQVVARRAGVVAGRACGLETFRQVDPLVEVSWHLADGSVVDAGTVIADVSGSLRSIAIAERTVLNFVCHLSGVATLTRRFVDAVASAGGATRVLDTRKTIPGLRALQKAAVRAGGGANHRGSLSEAVLVKDNHLGGTTIPEAVAAARRWWPGRMVEVECDRIDQAIEAAEAGATMVMLDNMAPPEVAECVRQLRQLPSGRHVLVEVSGGVDLHSAPAYASAGADLVSVGALTHSAPTLDVGFDLRGH